ERRSWNGNRYAASQRRATKRKTAIDSGPNGQGNIAVCPEPSIEPGSAAGDRARGFPQFLRRAAAGSRAEHRTCAGGAPGVEGTRIANQGCGIPEESIAGLAVAVAAVRREFRLRGNVVELDAAHLH